MRREIATGAAWMVLFRLIDRSLGLISTVILARLLLPADFGLVAMAMSIIGLIELATAFSFEIALIQKANPARVHYDTAFTLNILLATGGAVLTLGLAHPAAAFYDEPRLVPVMLAIGAAWLISGFENVGTVNFRRNMDFRREFRFLAYKRVISFGVAIAAAVTLRSYWALVIGMVTGRVAGVILGYLLEPFRPRLSLAASRQLFSFSGWMLVTNIAGAVVSKIPQFFVGRMFGAQTLGAYTVGAEIAQLAHTELVAPINRAMIPGYSRLADDLDAFRLTCIDSAGAILLLVLPASVGMAILAGPIVRVLLGEQWSEAVPVIQVLAFSGAVNAIVSNNHAAYVALGRPQLSAFILLSRVAVLIPLLFLLSTQLGLLGIVYAEFAAAAASLLVSYPMLFRQLRIPVLGYVRALWRPTLASAIMGFLVYGVLQLFAPHYSVATAVRDLVTGVVVGVLTYGLMLWGLWRLSHRPDTAEVAIARYGISACRSFINR
ncbi:MAG TPA: lipopolysaccharide biosynthesis protein, partial [Burkholderiaceae bacterium]|nr:lipopolysaccharide biosynthesis protein [Burkholderiaceae bacterium]